MEENENVVEQPMITPMSMADQYFIRDNYQKLTLEQLSLATGANPEDISAYVEAYQIYLKSEQVSEDKRLNFTISLDTTGSVSFGLEWPDLQSSEKIVPFVGKMFYLLNEGRLKPNLAAFLQQYAEERGAYTVIKSIMQSWNEQDSYVSERPIVLPNEVF
jgi:hypothetical protein